jgi:hypothetical protein
MRIIDKRIEKYQQDPSKDSQSAKSTTIHQKFFNEIDLGDSFSKPSARTYRPNSASLSSEIYCQK